ncbi:hypothetical protein BGW41_006978 [Actinomortierella wolfii]|nr:hypothetical protein BGW41_006978 [Actinomortierella wolfii]
MTEAAKKVVKAQSQDKFELSQASVVRTNFQIDKQICLKQPPDAACVVSIPKEKEVDTWVMLSARPTDYNQAFVFGAHAKVKPCAAYLHYVESKVLAGTSEHTLRKLRGYTSRFNVSAEVKAGVKGGILGCEASLEVTTGFSYGQEITQEAEETWKTTVSPGKYVVYQPVVVYAYRVDPESLSALIYKTSVTKENIIVNNPSIKFYEGKGPYSKYLYFFVPLYRNSPFTIPYSDDLVDDIAFDKLTDYIMGDGYSKWES